MSHEIQKFFDVFQEINASGDMDRMVSLYADPFMSADATGVRVVPLSDFRAALPKRKQLFATIGCTSTRLVSVEEETPLDDRYVMAKTAWRWEFKTAEPIQVASTFIIRTGETPQIVFYLTGDVMSVLRSRGLLPSATP